MLLCGFQHNKMGTGDEAILWVDERVLEYELYEGEQMTDVEIKLKKKFSKLEKALKELDSEKTSDGGVLSRGTTSVPAVKRGAGLALPFVSMTSNVSSGAPKRPRLLGEHSASSSAGSGLLGANLEPANYLRTEEWVAERSTDPLVFGLNGAAELNEGSNTLVIQLTMSTGSPRFSINICDRNTNSAADLASSVLPNVLLHVNPRLGRPSRRGRDGQNHIVLNNKVEGRWQTGQFCSPFPFTMGTSTELRVVFAPQGFVLLFDGRPADLFSYRQELNPEMDLVVHVATKDDYGNPEVVTMHNLWWGQQPLPAPHILAQLVDQQQQRQQQQQQRQRFQQQRQQGGGDGWGGRSEGFGSFGDGGAAVSPLEVYVGGLPDDCSKEELRAAMAHFRVDDVRLHRPGGLHVVAPRFAFVRFCTPQGASEAIQQMNGASFRGGQCTLRVSAARPSRR